MYGEIVCRAKNSRASIKDPENCNILSPDLHLGFTGEKAKWSLKSTVLVGDLPTAATHKYKLFILINHLKEGRKPLKGVCGTIELL